MKKTLLFYILFFLSKAVFSQTQEEVAVKNMLRAALNLSVSKQDSALFCANTALSKATEIQNTMLIFQANRTIAIIYEDNNQYENAEKYHASALEIAEKSLSDKEKLTMYNDWAIIHKKMKKYAIAREYHLKTIDCAIKIGDWEMVEDGYHGLGTMYSMLSDWEMAIQSYLKSIEAAEHRNNKAGVVLTMQNMSNIYLRAKNYAMAQQSIERTYALALELGDTMRTAAVLRIYGNIELAQKHFDAALEKSFTVKSIFERKNDKSRLSETYLSIAEIFTEQKKYKDAALYFEKSKALENYFSPYAKSNFYNKLGKMYLAQSQNKAAIVAFENSLNTLDTLSFKEITQENHLFLATIYKNEKKYDAAFFHLEKSNQLSVVLFQEDKQRNWAQNQLKFDIEKRDIEIAAQQQKLTQSKQTSSLLIGGLCLLSALLFFTWKQMKAKQRATQYAELLMKELHHRVKNNLQTITSIMRLQSRQITEPKVLNILNESRSRLETISLLHQQLYRTEEVQTVHLQQFISDLVQKLCFTYNFDETLLEKNIDIKPTYINADLALPIGLIINELLNNSFKYAFENTEKPSVKIILNSKSFHYADNGKGFEKIENPETAHTFGFQLITSLAKQLRAKSNFYNENGANFEMDFEC